MKIIQNLVLVKPDPTDKITLSTGASLYFDARFEEQKAAPQSGVVLVVPQKLRFSMVPGEPSVRYKTDMELEVGDRVIFNFNALDAAKKERMLFGDGFLVRYDQIYVAIRNGEVICLNGGVIVEPQTEEIKAKIIVPEYIKRKKSKGFGRVLYASKRPHERDCFQPDFNTLSCPMAMASKGKFKDMGRYVQPGDLVQFHTINAIPLQHHTETHGVLSKSVLYRMQHTDIEVVLEQKKGAKA
jgi:hypothetical protein